MPRARRIRWMLILLALAACGSRTPSGAGGSGAAVAPAPPIDAGAPPPPIDAGAAAPAPPADAGLADIGVAPCESVVARFLRCPGVPEESKHQMAEASKRWHEEADR